MSDIGHNSKNATGELLRGFVERVERLEEEKKSFADDIKDVFAEAASSGFDKKALRRIIAQRKKDADTVKEENAVFETYCHALGLDYLV